MENKPVRLYILRRQPHSVPERPPSWLVFLAYLAYLRAMKQKPPPEVAVLRMLIAVVGLVLVALMTVAAGAPEHLKDILSHWPILP